jgi:hypothetical protein
MAAYYKVEVTLNSQAVSVGLPSPQGVRVTLPLVGPAGEKGDKGDKGDPGDQGPQGVPGTGLEVLTTQGDILYQGASVGERLPIGAEGEVLKVESGVPAWGEAGEAYDQSLNTDDDVQFASVETGETRIDANGLLWDGSLVLNLETRTFKNSDGVDAIAFGGVAVGMGLPIEFAGEDAEADIATTRDNLGLGTAATSDAGDFAAAVHGHVAADVSDFSTAAAAAAPVQSVAGRTGTVTLAKADVGLSNVDNTSDLAKPISTATQTALDGKAATSHTHPASAITDFNTAAAAAAPVQSVNGNTGTVTVAVPSASTATPQALGTAAAGTSNDFARADHVHAMPSASDVGAVSSTQLPLDFAVGPSFFVDGHILRYDSANSAFILQNLGGAAVADIGTGAGTVAAGDDSRFSDIPDPSTATPQALGTAAAGTSDDYSRGDHIHAAPALNDLSNVSAATPSDNDVLTFDTATGTWVAEAPSGGGSGEVRSDFVSPYTYTGLAPAGTSDSTASWTIRRSEFDADGSFVATLTASAVEWDDRLTASYT